MSGVVYTLELENGCYYVGWSKCFESLGLRLGSHFSGQGAAWTKLHTPCKVTSVELGDKNLERETTLKLAKTYGWEKTRGAAWCQVNLKKNPQPPSADCYTQVLVKSQQQHIAHWIEDAKDSMSRVDFHLNSLVETVLDEGLPVEDPEEDQVLPVRDYDASLP